MAKGKLLKNSESISDELERIKNANNGIIEPKLVVAYARNPQTALHNRFEWDDTEAAERWRLHQARNIIRLEFRYVDKKATDQSKIILDITSRIKTRNVVRAFVSLTTKRKGQDAGYRDIYDVISDDEMREQLLEDAKKDMAIFRRKYYLLSELADVFTAMANVP